MTTETKQAEETKQVEMVNEIVALSKTAAENLALAEDAKEREARADAQVLAVVIEMVKPSLRALATRIQVSEETRWVNGNMQTETQVEYAKVAGVRIEGSGPMDRNRRDNDGRTDGVDVFLCTNGELVRVEYSGRWSRWQGASSRWEAEWSTLPLDAYIRTYSLSSFLISLRDALRKEALGNRAAQAKSRTERAAKVEALLALLKR